RRLLRHASYGLLACRSDPVLYVRGRGGGFNRPHVPTTASSAATPPERTLTRPNGPPRLRFPHPEPIAPSPGPRFRGPDLACRRCTTDTGPALHSILHALRRDNHQQ